MKSSLLIRVALGASLGCLTATATTVVRSVLNPANSHTYHMLHGDDGYSGITWSEAETKAQELGGHLVTINDAAENSWILQNFTGNYFGDGTDYYVWIGLNDATIEGQFEWVSGEPVTFTDWYSGEPNDLNGIEDYAHIYNFSSGSFQWNDVDGGTRYFYSWPMSGLVEVPTVPDTTSFGSQLAVLLAVFGGQAWVRRHHRRDTLPRRTT